MSNRLNQDQLEILKSNYCYRIIDGMDYKTLEQLCYDYMYASVENNTEKEMIEEIEFYYPEESEDMISEIIWLLLVIHSEFLIVITNSLCNSY